MKENERKNIWKTPQYCITIFVFISAFTTGQGMTENFFNGNIICGIGISIGIQLLLVWMGWKVPKLFVAGNVCTGILLIVLYLFTVFWSTGFSFIYVCNQIYATTHMRDGQEILEDNYRRDLLLIQDIANERYLYAVNSLKEGLDMLQTNAKNIDKENNNKIKPVLGLKKLERKYSNDTEMSLVIKNARKIKKHKFSGDVTRMIDIINNRIENLENEMSRLKGEINDKQEDIKDNIKSIVMIDESSPSSEYHINKSKIELEAENDKLREEINALSKAKNTLQKIKNRLDNLNAFLNNRKNDLETKLISDFAIILQKLGIKNPEESDITTAEDKANAIYEKIVDGMKQHSKMEYGKFLQDYLEFSKALDNLKIIRSIQTSNDDKQITKTLKDTEELVKTFPKKKEKKDWTDKWNKALSDLKQNFNILKILFTGKKSVDNYKAESKATPNTDAKVNSEITLNEDMNTITDATAEISNLQRSLLTEINGIESAIYYLRSEHCLLAVLSLALATFLDTVPVLLMIVKEGIRRKNG